MNNTRKRISGITRAISMKRLIALSGRKSVFPFYHVVNDEHLPHISNLYQVRSVQQFRDDLDFLCSAFEPIDIAQLEQNVLNPAAVKKPYFHLTFDDGLREVKDVVAPILREKGIPATFFVNSGFVDNKGLFYRYKVSLALEKMKEASEAKLAKIAQMLEIESSTNLESAMKALRYSDIPLIDDVCKILEIDIEAWLSEKQPYLSTADCIQLQKEGFQMGSHSVDHPRFKYLDLDAQKKQLSDCSKDLATKLGLLKNYFSFPFSDEEVSMAFFTWMYRKQHCRLSFGISGQKDDIDIRHIHRVLMEEGDASAADIIKSEYGYYILKKFVGKNKISRK